MGKGKTAEILKCFNCICAVETPDGLWCIRFKGIPKKMMARECKNFVDKRAIKGFKNDTGQ